MTDEDSDLTQVLTRLLQVDQAAAAFAAMTCIEHVRLKVWPGQDLVSRRFRELVRVTMRWAQGRDPLRAVADARRPLWGRDALPSGRLLIQAADAVYKSCHLHHVDRGLLGCVKPLTDSIIAARADAHRYDGYHHAKRQISVNLGRVALEARWPLSSPTPEQISSARAEVQVAWDLIESKGRKDLSMADLIRACTWLTENRVWAGVLLGDGDWWPNQVIRPPHFGRAFAERITQDNELNVVYILGMSK